LHVAVVKLSIHVYASQSLKDKRRTIQSMKDRLRRKFGVSVAEVGGQDTWQLAELGVVAVSGDLTTLEQLVDSAVRYAIENYPEAEVNRTEYDVFSY
jgi:hypothetical protein